MSKTIPKSNNKYKKFRDFYEEDESPTNKRQKQRFNESKKHKDRLRHELRKGNFQIAEEYDS